METRTCKYCGFVISSKAATPGHYRVCADYKDFVEGVNATLTEAYLQDNYLESGKSLKALAAELGLDKVRLLEAKLVEYGIPKRTLQEAKQQKHHVQLARQTSLERYGVEYHLQKGSTLLEKAQATYDERYGGLKPCQTDEVKEVIKQSNLKRYGVENASSAQVIKNRRIATMQARYGVDYIGQYPEVIQKSLLTKSTAGKPNIYSSKKATAFFDALNEMLPSHLQEDARYYGHRGEFGHRDPETGEYYFYDFVIPSIKLAVEYNGDYYHANPDKYAADWLNKKRGMTAAEIWAHDEQKALSLHRQGYNVLSVWESDDTETITQTILQTINQQDHA